MDCPFIDTDRPECSERLNMGHINDAFGLCVSKYFLCPLYLDLSRSPDTTGMPAAVAAAGPVGPI